MAANEYHFVTYWRVPGTLEEVQAVLYDAASLPRWWPSVYLEAQVLEPGGPDGVGRVVALHTRGWLPYTLRWQFRIVEVHPNGFTLEAWGDFVGRGIWTYVQDEGEVVIIYDWAIQAEKPLLRRFSPVMRPLFEANHRWSMAQGEKSLRLELVRRRAATPAERALVPAPPRAARWPSPRAAALGAASLSGVGVVLWLLGRGRRRK